MAYKNQQDFIDKLESAGELIRIEAYVNPKLEMAEITDRMSKQPGGGKALLFENTGYDFPVLMNAYGSEKRMCMALGVQHLDDVAKEIENLFKLLSAPKEGLLDKLKMLPKLGHFSSWCRQEKIDGGKAKTFCWVERNIQSFLLLPVGQKMVARSSRFLLFIQK